MSPVQISDLSTSKIGQIDLKRCLSLVPLVNFVRLFIVRLMYSPVTLSSSCATLPSNMVFITVSSYQDLT
jgi:hypothetical protein